MTQLEQVDIQKPFGINGWQVDPALCRIKYGSKEIKLEPKVMTVLLCLAQHAGQVMSREQLESMAWKDMVVGYDSLASSINKLRKAFGDDSKNPQFIETVPKRGYRLIAQLGVIQAIEIDTSLERPINIEVSESFAKSNKLTHLLYIAVFLFATVLFVTWILSDSEPEPVVQSIKPSIAILPFQNLSSDPNQDYFSDGMTADIITDLSKISGIAVIAKNSVFAYKDTDVDIRQLKNTLGVSYVVEGSVRKDGNKVRISARLIDAQNSHNLWADRFDGTLTNIFALQDEVTQKIVSSLAIQLTDNERSQLAQEYTKSIEAYDEFLHGWQLIWFLSKEANLRAREHFNRAIELDSQFARAYANLALTYAYEYLNGWHNDPKNSIQQARYYADKGVELDPTIPQVHWVMSLVHIFSKEYQLALQSAEKTLLLNPNYADGYGIMSTILNYAGQPKKALDVMKKAMRLNPHHPSIYQIIRAEIHFNLHEYDNTIEYLNLALQRNPEAQEARLWLAAAYAHKGQIEEANWQLEHIRQAEIELTLDYVENVIPLNDPGQRKHLLDGLFKAGLANKSQI